VTERDADFTKLEEEQNIQPPPARPGNSPEPDGNGRSPEIEALRAELAEMKDKYLRTLADLENNRKRHVKERSELLKYQGDKILHDILEVADNLERALAEAEKDPNSLKDGVPLIYKLLMDTLAKWEVKPESGVGKPFDPAKYRALSRIAVDDAIPGTIISEMRKTYFYKDKLLRAGEVIVAGERPKETEEASEEVPE
jgi:molecular chaperone GrpE